MTHEQNQKINFILKRDNSVVDFDSDKIVVAIKKALKESGEYKDGLDVDLSKQVVKKIRDSHQEEGSIPSVESIQDMVEIVLMDNELHITAKAYILYREKHALLRKKDIFKKRVAFL